MSIRDIMSADEIAWWRSFRRVIGRMPLSVELNARVGEIGIATIGARRISCDQHGDADHIAETEMACVKIPRLKEGFRDDHAEANTALVEAISPMLVALRAIAEMPIPEQDNMLSANMRIIAKAAIEKATKP